MSFVCLHHHTHFSTFDGFGRSADGAKRAKKLGHNALGITDHGQVCGLIEHYTACKDEGIKPILGCELYFQKEFKPEDNRYHLTALCKSLEGYQNLMRMLSIANREKFYRYPIVDWELLDQYHDGLVILSGCLAGYLSRLVLARGWNTARRTVEHFTKLFGSDYFIEIQPINTEKDGQKKANEGLLRLAEEFGLRPVMTVDSHFVSPKDYDTYQVMHKLAKREPHADYSKRYMPDESEIHDSWVEMHGEHDVFKRACQTTQDIADSCNVELEFKEMIPKIEWDLPSKKKLKQIAVQGLKGRDKYDESYKARLVRELDVVFGKGFEDYFLLCYDIVSWARSQGIGVGFGRGSVCGSLLAYAIGLTQVDPLVLGTHFERFLRPDKNVIPDIDIDFDSERRSEVIDYVLRRFEGRAQPISTYGYYKVRNLANDLIKLYEMDPEDAEVFKRVLAQLVEDDSDVEPDRKSLLRHPSLRALNQKYPGVVKHFSKLFGQVRFIGKHAAGIAIAADELEKYAATMRVRGELQTCYDLNSLGKINVVKIDVLGLSTVSIVEAAAKRAKVEWHDEYLDDEEVYKAFSECRTDAIFQFEKGGAKGILNKVRPDNFQELIACTALNRPGPIQLGVLDAYVDGKAGRADKRTLWYKYTKDAHGTLIYQEHVMWICRELAGMDWPDIDKVMKNLRVGDDDVVVKLRQKFIDGCREISHMKENVAADLYNKMTLYLFNKGHGAGYCITAFFQQWLHIHYPLEFWWATLRYEHDEYKRRIYQGKAAEEGIVILIPHVNGRAHDRIRKYEGERVIQLGLSSIKGVGLKAAQAIESKGPYTDDLQFHESHEKRVVNARVTKALEEAGALEFNDSKFMERCIRANQTWLHNGRGGIR